eukprot:CAMPEP_0202340852 /NCGR_PEP_ID=MMETSP1126-20121109/2116_1 /ASSEMBLY_ACC=CAM_ASM_000457 /TAXON_ID=3047 /ORGANISM="Dunaliella tertiolecta, Strain CCMP1320" /LENGTH=155 /DNA_ID=CAMNT_0048931621 /DNA_START=1021 /DNA_END=1490 /DNA_ORIENTATION=-
MASGSAAASWMPSLMWSKKDWASLGPSGSFPNTSLTRGPLQSSLSLRKQHAQPPAQAFSGAHRRAAAPSPASSCPPHQQRQLTPAAPHTYLYMLAEHPEWHQHAQQQDGLECSLEDGSSYLPMFVHCVECCMRGGCCRQGDESFTCVSNLALAVL